MKLVSIPLLLFFSIFYESICAQPTYGEKIPKSGIEKLLLLPFGLGVYVGDDHIPRIEKASSKTIAENVADALEEATIDLESERKTVTEEDSILQAELLKTFQLISRRRTVKACPIPPLSLELMRKTKSDFALVIYYEYWERSKLNESKYKRMITFQPTAFGVKVIRPNTDNSFIMAMVFDRKRNRVYSYYSSGDMEKDPERTRKLVKKLFKEMIDVNR